MVYDPTSLYTMGYDSHGIHNSGYVEPMNMYLPPPPSSSSSSSIPQNSTEVSRKFHFFSY